MSDKITFYFNPRSRARTALWALEESGAPYEIKELNFEAGENKKAEFLKINPMGKIPVIVHNGIVVTEAAAICAYLADAFPEAKLAPAPSDPHRGAYYRWLFFAASCIEPALLDKTYPRTGGLKSSALGHGNHYDVIATLEKAVARGHLLGGDFTMADLYMAANIEWGMYMRAIEEKPVFKNYLALCKDRPAYKRFEERAGAVG